MKARPVLPFAGAGVIALGLFLLMQFMIRGGDLQDWTQRKRVAIDFVRLEPPEQRLETKQRRRPEEPPPPEDPPPPPEMPVAQYSKPAPQALDINIPDLDLRMDISGGPYLGGLQSGAQVAAQGDVIPIVRVAPQYPRRALMARIEGYVTMEFTIAPDGTVSDIDIVAAKPPGVFNAAAVAALRRWKFKPRLVDGKPVAQRARQTIDFALEGG